MTANEAWEDIGALHRNYPSSYPTVGLGTLLLPCWLPLADYTDFSEGRMAEKVLE